MPNILKHSILLHFTLVVNASLPEPLKLLDIISGWISEAEGIM